MSCKDTESLLHGYVDGELDLIRNLEVEHHLQNCQVCSQECKNHQTLRSAIRTGSLYFKSPPNLQERIHSALRKAAKAEAKPRLVAWRMPCRPLGVG